MIETKKIIYTSNAPKPIGPYSQAVQTGNLVFISGQIALEPTSNEMSNKSLEAEATQVFNNLKSICEAAGSSINNIIKLNLYLVDLSKFNIINNIICEYFNEPYPARACVEVSALPKGANFEAEAVLLINK